MNSGSWKSRLVVFLPFKGEEYSLIRHLDYWPIAFAGSFLLSMIAQHGRKLMPRIGEGVTLLHSLTLFYFMAEYFPVGEGGLWWIIITFIPFAYSLVHALILSEITTRDRLYLSIWSSFVMLIFAGVYVYDVWNMRSVEHLISENDVWGSVFVFLKYFFLGASGAYIAMNALMLFSYLPGKNQFFNEAYFAEIRKSNQKHIDRYSSEQVDRKEALFVLLLIGGCLVLNYKTKFVSPSFAVWLCLILAPLLVGLLRNEDSQK